MTIEKPMEKGNAGDLTDFNSKANLVVPDIKLYRRRWCIIFLYAFLEILSSFQWSEMPIVEDVLVKYYQVDSKWIEWTATVWGLTSALLSIPGSWLVGKYGLRVIMALFAFFTMLGSVLKAFASGRQDFPLVFFGSFILSLPQAVAMSLPPTIASVWFGSNEVATATSIGIFGVSIGTALGLAIPPFVIVASADMHDTKVRLDYLNWTMSGLSLLLFVCILIWFQDKPPTPPSKASLKQMELKSDDVPFYASVKALIQNPNYLLLLLTFGIHMGISSALPILLNAFILPFYPTAQKDIGMIGLTYSISGLFSLIASGLVFDKTSKFKEVYLSTFFLSTLSLLALTLFFKQESIVTLYITVGIFGFFSCSLITMSYEMGNELTYPIPASVVDGIMLAISQIFTVVFATAGGFLLPHIGVLGCLYILTALFGVGTVLVCFMPKTCLRRMANEATAQLDLRIDQRNSTII